MLLAPAYILDRTKPRSVCGQRQSGAFSFGDTSNGMAFNFRIRRALRSVGSWTDSQRQKPSSAATSRQWTRLFACLLEQKEQDGNASGSFSCGKRVSWIASREASGQPQEPEQARQLCCKSRIHHWKRERPPSRRNGTNSSLSTHHSINRQKDICVWNVKDEHRSNPWRADENHLKDGGGLTMLSPSPTPAP